MNDQSTYALPLFPLNTVLFPTNRLPLRIFEARYVDLVGRCMRDSEPFGVIGIATGQETGAPAKTFEVGTLATIIDFDRGEDGLLNIVIEGGGRFHLHDASANDDNLLVGQVSELIALPDTPIPDDFRPLVELLNSAQSDRNAPPIMSPKTAAELAYTIAQFLPISIEAKVAMLGAESAEELLNSVASVVAAIGQRQSAENS